MRITTCPSAGKKGVSAVSPAGAACCNRELADYNNERLGVTPAQEKAMKTGSMFGWDVSGANPKVYEQNGMKMGGMTLG